MSCRNFSRNNEINLNSVKGHRNIEFPLMPSMTAGMTHLPALGWSLVIHLFVKWDMQGKHWWGVQGFSLELLSVIGISLGFLPSVLISSILCSFFTHPPFYLLCFFFFDRSSLCNPIGSQFIASLSSFVIWLLECASRPGLGATVKSLNRSHLVLFLLYVLPSWVFTVLSFLYPPFSFGVCVCVFIKWEQKNQNNNK